MYKDFLATADRLLVENINKTSEFIVLNRSQLISTFSKHFTNVCSNIVQLQSDSSMPPIAIIEYTMLRSNFINRSYVAEVWAYNEGWYADPNQRMVGELDLSGHFIYFDKLWDELLKERKRYIGEARPIEIKAYMMRVLPSFFSHVVSIARAALDEAMDSNALTGINKHESFRIYAGEHMNINNPAPIYIETKEKNASETMKRFDEKNSGSLDVGDYSHMDFSDCDASMMNLSFSQFRHSNFANSILHNAELKGTNFHRAIMDNCQLTKCAIHEANFSHASLRGANFTDSQGNAASLSSSSLQLADCVGLTPVNFRHADLTYACFRNACLAGADFADAKLDRADFTNAALSDANFASASLKNTVFLNAELEGATFDARNARQTKNEHVGPAKNKLELSTYECKSMRYFLLEALEQTTLPSPGKHKKTTIVSSVAGFDEIDYDEKNGLISDSFKTLLKMYMPMYEFDPVPVTYLSEDRSGMAVYWRFAPPQFDDIAAAYRNDGHVSRIKFNGEQKPLVFTAKSLKGKRSIVARLAVVESALRRGILGLKFTRLMDIEQPDL